jgi:hypothetical protein
LDWKGSDKKKKLTKVLSTKLSIEDYHRFEKCANFAYQAGMIEEPSTSKFLGFIVTYPFNRLGNVRFHPDILIGLSLHSVDLLHVSSFLVVVFFLLDCISPTIR